MNLAILPTGDGSHTLYDAVLNETYHSRHGARHESEHVYLRHGLQYVLSGRRAVRVLEVGFGTGLNIWLTACEAIAHPSVFFHVETIEPAPLSWELVCQLNLFDPPEQGLSAQQLHAAPWNEAIRLLPNFRLWKHCAPVMDVPFPAAFFDVVYFDAFAPDKQPAMWTPAVLARMFAITAPGGVLVTYCAKGQVKRDLRACGFVVEALPGPPGKREMVRAVKVA